MIQLSPDEEDVWKKFQKGMSTSEIASLSDPKEWSVSYVSRVLNRARKKIVKVLEEHAKSHRLDIESILDYQGILIGFDYAANTQVYIVFTINLGVVVWYKHDSYAGKLCPDCPNESDCWETLSTITKEYAINLREDEMGQPMTQKSITIFNKLVMKEIPRYKRIKKGKEKFENHQTT